MDPPSGRGAENLSGAEDGVQRGQVRGWAGNGCDVPHYTTLHQTALLFYARLGKAMPL